MTSKKTAAKQTPAEIVEPEVVAQDSLVILHMQPGDSIEANFEELKAHIESIVEDFKGAIVTDVKQAKRERAYLNNVSKSLNQRRKDVKDRYMAPLLAFEARVKELDAPIKEASEAIDRQIKAAEEAERVEKRVELVKHYEEYAGALADVVPFERIEDAKWILKTTNLMAAFAEIEAVVERIAVDEATLSDLNLSHPIDAKAEYFQTLDMSKAIARSKQLDDQLARAEALEAEKQAILRQREEAAAEALAAAQTVEPAPVAEETPAPVEAPVAPRARTWVFEVDCTRDELDGVLAYLKSAGLHGMVRV